MRNFILAALLLVSLAGCSTLQPAVSDSSLSAQQEAVQYLQLSDVGMAALRDTWVASGRTIPDQVDVAVGYYHAAVQYYSKAVVEAQSAPEVERLWVVARNALTAAADAVAAVQAKS